MDKELTLVANEPLMHRGHIVAQGEVFQASLPEAVSLVHSHKATALPLRQRLPNYYRRRDMIAER